jgi:hypothetical protein
VDTPLATMQKCDSRRRDGLVRSDAEQTACAVATAALIARKAVR